jgi:hypothetical protein
VERCVTLHWIDIAVVLAAVLSGSGVTFVVLQRLLRRDVLRQQAAIEQKLLALTDALHSIRARLADPSDSSVAAPTAPEFLADLDDPATETRVESIQEEIAPEIMAAITAATAAFVGQDARIRSVRSLPGRQSVSPWSQQGRVVVQASHNLRARR